MGVQRITAAQTVANPQRGRGHWLQDCLCSGVVHKAVILLQTSFFQRIIIIIHLFKKTPTSYGITTSVVVQPQNISI